MAKNKMTKDTIPVDFTLKLAIVDAIPVLFFAASMILVGLMFSSPLFLLGSAMCLIAGAAKVVWKIIVVLYKRNIWFLFIQMRILMPIGMVLMITGIIVHKNALSFATIISAGTCLPTVIFFIAGIVGMLMMIVFALKLDSSNVKANWVEQLTNGAAQICFFIGLLMIYTSI